MEGAPALGIKTWYNLDMRVANAGYSLNLTLPNIPASLRINRLPDS